MPQLSLYLDDKTMESLRRNADLAGLSLSKYATEALHDAECRWPDGFWDLFGSIDDDTFDVPDEIPFSLDAPRGDL